MAINRVTAVWSGFRGAPGYSNFYFGADGGAEFPVQGDADAVREFFQAIRTFLPSGTRVDVSAEVATIDETSGNITDLLAITPPAQVLGSATGGYSAATGAVVNWLTGTYLRGRRLRGKTFIVPLASSSFDTNGDLSSATLAAIRGAASTLVGVSGSRGMRVWSRPVGGAGGSSALVIASSVPDLGAVLKSRRD